MNIHICVNKQQSLYFCDKSKLSVRDMKKYRLPVQPVLLHSDAHPAHSATV